MSCFVVLSPSRPVWRSAARRARPPPTQGQLQPPTQARPAAASGVSLRSTCVGEFDLCRRSMTAGPKPTPRSPPSLRTAAAPAADSGAPPPPGDQSVPPVDDGRVESTPPVTTKSPDGWTLSVSAHDETEMPVPSLTNEAATREFIVGGVFNGSVHAPAGAGAPRGTFEVGYQIACGGDLSTTPGIALSGSIGLLPAAGLTVSLKPGVVNIIPVTKKEFNGGDPWVMISGFSLKIDGCIGKSFHPLLRHTDQVDRHLRRDPVVLRHNQNRLGAP